MPVDQFIRRQSLLLLLIGFLFTTVGCGQPAGEVMFATGHAEAVREFTWSVDGSWVASLGGEGFTKLWSMPEARLISEMKGEVVFSPDGLFFVTVDQNVLELRATEGTIIATHQFNNRPCISFSPDGGAVIAAAGKEIQIWMLPNGQKKKMLESENDLIKVEVAADDRWLIAYPQRGSLEMWSWPDLERRLLLKASANDFAIALHPDGRRWVVRIADNGCGYSIEKVVVWSTESGEVERVLESSPDPNDFTLYSAPVINEAGSEAAYLRASDLGRREERYTLVVRDIEGGAVLREIPVTREAVMAAGEIVTAQQGVIIILPPFGNAPITLEPSTSGPTLNYTEWSPGNRYLVLRASYDAGDLELASPAIRRRYGLMRDVNGFAFSNDDRWFLTTQKDKQGYLLILWSLPDFQQQASILLSEKPKSFSVSPDGRWIVIGKENGDVAFWSVAESQYLREITAGATPIQSFSFSADGSFLAVGRRDGRVTVLQYPEWESLITWEASDGVVDSVAISPEKDEVTTLQKKGYMVGSQAVIRRWSYPELRQTNEIQVAAWDPQTVGYTKDGDLLVAGVNGQVFSWILAVWPRSGPLQTLDQRKVESSMCLSMKLWENATVLKAWCNEYDLGTSWSIRNRSFEKMPAPSRKTDQYQIVASGKGNAEVRDAHDQLLGKLEGGRTPYAISPDNAVVIDGSFQLWMLPTLEKLRRLPIENIPGEIAFSNNGRLLFLRFDELAEGYLYGGSEYQIWSINPEERLHSFFSGDCANQVLMGDDYVLYADADGSLNWISTDNGQKVLAARFSGGNDWAVYAPGGYIKSSPEATKMLQWKVDADAVGNQDIAEACTITDLPSLILSGKRIGKLKQWKCARALK